MGPRVLVVGGRIGPGWMEALEWRLERASTRRETLSKLSEPDLDCVVAVESD